MAGPFVCPVNVANVLWRAVPTGNSCKWIIGKMWQTERELLLIVKSRCKIAAKCTSSYTCCSQTSRAENNNAPGFRGVVR